MKKDSDADGYLLLKKSAGLTSFDSLSLVKRSLGTHRLGHTGTLDKFAEGLLVILVGRSTKLVPWFSAQDKVYEGVFHFGIETDTLDCEGVEIARAEVPTEDAILAQLPSFTGTILQRPPEYSAIHIQGKRASDLARSGVSVEMKSRSIVIYDFELLDFQAPRATFRIHCSSGTYIRSLARDLARAVGSRAFVEKLVRTSVGQFSLYDAVDVSETEDAPEAVRRALKKVDRAAFEALGAAIFEAEDPVARNIALGRPLQFEALKRQGPENPSDLGNFGGVFSQDGRFLAVITQENGLWRYGYVYDRP